MSPILRRRFPNFNFQLIFNSVLLATTSILAMVALSLPIALRQISFPIKIGDVASQDIQSPNSLSYESQILTEGSRIDAEKAISNIYQPTDPTISRKQIEKLKVALGFISNVKADGFASNDQKMADLFAISEFHPTKGLSETLLIISDSRWQTIQQESITVLEQVMRNTIREGQEAEAQKSISTLISYSIPQEQALIVAELVFPFVTANSVFNKEESLKARVSARNNIKPVIRNFVAGETIVRRGQVINSITLEALQAFGLVEENSGIQSFIASFSMILVISASVGLYFYRRNFSAFYDKKRLVIIAIFFLVFLFSLRFIIPNRTILPYLFPLAAFGLTIGSLFPIEVGVILSISISTLAGYGMTNSFELTLFYIFSTLCGISILGKGRRIINFFWSGLAIGFAGSAIILAFRLNDSITDGVGIATLIGVCFINGLASASLALLFQYLLSQILGIITPLQLLDLSRPDHPLLQYLLRNAPGTYQHSLQVANLTEQAAETIGADAMLVRVGCLYHDVGKAANPAFFIENQSPGSINPHDNLDPIEAAQTIIQHVTDGVLISHRFRIPTRIIDFIKEHHGSLLARYHYTRAIQAADNDPERVDKEQFRYPGPRPRSKETVLLMLADGCEARFRAESPKTDDELRQLVKKVFDFLLQEGQLDDSVLTLHDLHQVTEVFITTFKNTYHPRLKYPELRTRESIIQPKEGQAAPAIRNRGMKKK